ncbi:MAG: SH3 domain-containing protein [Bacteroidaceae bacterium]|nr:SH3 domain-containing protein [Bacteroidaceae bacterium]
MRLKRFIFTLMMTLIVVTALAENNYKVTSSSRLNVRKSPSTSAAVLGTFKSGQQIEVISINNGWAEVIYNGKTGYVSTKYITPLPKPEEPAKPKEEPQQETIVIEDRCEELITSSTGDRDTANVDQYEVETPLVIRTSMPNALNLYLAVQGGFGWSNFLWDNGSVNGTMAYSCNILAQLYFEDKVIFIPQNWYSEIALGYNKFGAAGFNMNYMHLGLCPFGYRVLLDPINIVVKAGVDLAFPLNNLETSRNSWSADFQCGLLGGLQIEWKQFAIGCNVVYDFTEVSSSNNQTLNNIGVLGTISYKFGKFGHKK